MANTERVARDAAFDLEMFEKHVPVYRKFSTGRCNVNPNQPDEKYDRWVEMEGRRLFLELLPVEQGFYPQKTYRKWLLVRSAKSGACAHSQEA